MFYVFNMSNLYYFNIIYIYIFLHKESDSSQRSTQRYDLIWNDMKKQNKLNPEERILKTLHETYLQSYSTDTSFRHLCKNAVKWGCCQK